MNHPLLKVGFSYAKKHMLQSSLLVLGVALGVALVVSVDLANRSASRSLALSTETLGGGFTHRIRADSGGVDEDLYGDLRLGLGIRKLAPYVEDYVNAAGLDGRPLRLLGIDPFSLLDSGEGGRGLFGRLPGAAFGELLTEPGSALISGDLASEFGIGTGDTVGLEYGALRINVRIEGLLSSGDKGGSRALDGVLITDISTAQELLGKPGVLTYIDLAVDSDAEGSAELARVQEILPPGVRIERTDSLLDSTRRLTGAFELNLLALSLLALFVGVFLIYNTVTFSVLERRPVYGTLRALGVTGRELLKTVLAETLLLGLAGSVIGVALGIILGRGIVGLVTRTINDLYFTLTVTDFSVSFYTLIKGALLGILASFLAAVVPAFEASRVEPAGALRRSRLESLVVRSMPFLALSGAGLAALGVLFLYVPPRSLGMSLISLFLILLGASFLVPPATRLLMRLVSALVERAGVLSRMAPRSVSRSISRTGVAVASLTVAVSVIVSVSIMIGSFRTTVVEWLDYTLNADIFITAPSGGVSGGAGIDPGLRDRVAGFPGVDRVAAARRATLMTPRYGSFNVFAVTEGIAVENRRFLWSEAEGPDLWKKLQSGSVLVSESFAYRNGIRRGPGGAVRLPTKTGPKDFEVSGIYYDYGSQSGVVLMAEPVYRRHWKDRKISSLAAYVSPGEDVGMVLEALRLSLSPEYNLGFQSNRDLRGSAMDTFDRTFTVTSALRILVILVAFIGVLSSLMSLQLERVREFGALRALGMTTAQLRRMTFIENGIIGAAAGLFSLPVGVALSLVLIYVVNLRSFGWTLEFAARPRYFIEAVAISLLAAVCAGIYPALRMGRERTAAMIRDE